MDAALAQPTTYQSSYIPNEIYQPLLEIAQRGYNPNDIFHWYLAIKQRVDTANTPAPYSLTPPFSVCSPAPYDPHSQLLNSGAISPIDASGLVPNGYNGTQAEVNHWPETISYSTPRRASLQITTPPPHPHQQTRNSSTDLQGNILQMLPSWNAGKPARTSEADVQNLTTTANEVENPTANMATHTQWFTPSTLDVHNEVSRKRTASQSSLYQEVMNNPAIPFLSSTSQSGASFVPITAGGDITYLAPISIIPSRKRRKTLRKGEKKIIQPMQLARQPM